MPTMYQARVLVNMQGVSKRTFKWVDENLSRIVWENEQSRDAVVLSSIRHKEIKILLAIEAGSSSTAATRLDQLVRTYAYKLEAQNSFARNAKPKPTKSPSLERELLFA